MSKKSKKVLKVVGICAAVLSGLLTISSIATCASEETKELIGFDYTVAEVNTAGEIVKSEAAIVSKEVNVDGLEVTVGEDFEGSYEVAFFDEDGEYISTVGPLTDDFEALNIPEGAETAIIEYTPEDDKEISWLEKFEYASHLEISYNK